MRQKLNLGIVVTIASLITYLSLRPVPGSVGNYVDDFIIHLGGYFLLAGALLIYFHDTKRGHLEAIIVAAGLGLGIELLQSQIPYRYYGTDDVVANTIGASLVFLDHRSRIVTRIIEMEDRFLERILPDSF